MKAKHWCPHKIEYFAQIFDRDTFKYLASVEPLGPALNYEACATYSHCIADSVDWNNYKTRHTSDNCACTMVEIYYPHLTMVIEQGCVPLIEIE